MRTHLHKDSLARQQQEQQLKSLLGSSLSTSSQSSPQPQPQPHPQPATAAAVAAAAAAAVAAAAASTIAAPNQLDTNQIGPADSASFALQSQRNSDASAVGALLNQQLVAALKQQQQQQPSTRARSRSSLEPPAGSLPARAADLLLCNQTISPSPAANQLQQQQLSDLSLAQPNPMAGESQAAKFLRHQQIDPKALMMGALQGDQLGLESVRAVMLAAAAAAAAVSQHQHQHRHHFPLPTANQRQDQQRPARVGDKEAAADEEEGEESGRERELHLAASSPQRLRGKRRKQVNPRSTRSHQQPMASSLNSGDESDEERQSLPDEGHLAGQAADRLRSSANNDSMLANEEPIVARQRRAAAVSASGFQTGSDNSAASGDETDEDLGATDERGAATVIKREVEDFNNNKGEQHTGDHQLGPSAMDEGGDEELNATAEDDDDDEMIKMNFRSSMTSDDDGGEEDDELCFASDGGNMSENTNSNQQAQQPQSTTTTAATTTTTTSPSEQMKPNENPNDGADLEQAKHETQISQTKLNQVAGLMTPMTTLNGEIIEDISQSYVKTANPNAARKGGKRNRHCYKCKLCTYSSVDRCTLVRHLRIHSGERPYICGICRYAFTTKANCERHVRKRHKKQYNSLGGAGGGGVKGSNGGGRSLIITDHSNHQTIPVKVNPVAAQTISQTLQRIQEKQQRQAGSADEEFDQIERIAANTSDANQRVHKLNNLDTQQTKYETSSPGGEYKSKRKHRGDSALGHDIPYQRRRLIDKQTDESFALTRFSSRKGAELRNQGQNLLFNPPTNSLITAASSAPKISTSTNDLFVNLMAQLQQVTSQQDSNISHTNTNTTTTPTTMDPNNTNIKNIAPLIIPQTASCGPGGTQTIGANFLASMLAAGKSLATADDQQSNEVVQRTLLSPKHLSQQFAQLRNLNPQAPFFVRRNPLDPFNPVDLAAQALDLSCKFQSSK